jgi:hypothetical protein
MSKRKSREKIFYVYALLDTRKPGPFYFKRWKFDFLPFYIGKGKGTRVHSHSKCLVKDVLDANKHKLNVIKKIAKETGQVHAYVIKRKNLTELQAFSLERKLISVIGRADLKEGALTNKTSGGDGVTGRVITEELRQAFSDLWNSRTAAEKKEIKKKQSAAHRNKTAAEKEALSKKLSKAQKARTDLRKYSEASRKTMSEAQQKRFKKKEERLKISEAVKLSVAKNVTKHKRAVKKRTATLQSDEYRERASKRTTQINKDDPSIVKKQQKARNKTQAERDYFSQISKTLGGKPVEVIKNGKSRIFRSQRQTAMFLKCHPLRVNNCLHLHNGIYSNSVRLRFVS